MVLENCDTSLCAQGAWKLRHLTHFRGSVLEDCDTSGTLGAGCLRTATPHALWFVVQATGERTGFMVGAYGNLRGPTGTYGSLREPMEAYGDLWGATGAYGNLREPTGAYGDVREPTGVYGWSLVSLWDLMEEVFFGCCGILSRTRGS